MTILLLLIGAIIAIFMVPKFRMTLISLPALNFIRKVLPPLSQTEREAMEAGDTWWDAELFAGNPDWNKLHAYDKPILSADEQKFIDNQLATALAMIDDHQITAELGDLPPELWQYFRDNKFFALIIPKKYGGLAFSAYANSTIVSQLASRSISAAVTVMVPNSLGPGELLAHYGTTEQKERWLPALANGQEIPCFALTGPEAGSDAGAISDVGIVCEREFEGQRQLGLSLTWNKRYITLAPVATVLGLAFKMRDPDNLLGDQTELGITCALIPTSHPGVIHGARHHPMGLAFMNGTTSGEDVFIPLDWIIGGPSYAGKGWRMLVECLSAGRGISLPALATATAHMACKSTTAYAAVRHQFGVAIQQFEGVQEALARIIANTYQLEAARRLTTTALDLKAKPGVVTAIAKYHMTELGRSVINDAMDIQAGKGVQLGPKNILAYHYIANPISITVEGANILTRSLMIFGQGATRCHPYVLDEMRVAAMEDEQAALLEFDKLLSRHMLYTASNGARAFGHALTASVFAQSPVSGPTRSYYQQLTRLSAALALISDLAMLTLGGQLKRKEMLSARLGDVLSQLYLASATLKMFEDNGHQYDDLPAVEFALQSQLHQAALALENAIQNFPNRFIRWKLSWAIFPLGNRFTPPNDALSTQVVHSMSTPNPARERITHLCGDLSLGVTGMSVIEQAFELQYRLRSLLKRINHAQRAGNLAKHLYGADLYQLAFESELVNEEELAQLMKYETVRAATIAVDEFPAH
ncbi:acyl-CoA dehydrogenase [Shewanella sp. NIFS-20-20]|uniref:acyl-CoA dehydrogenase n=1 Tax=Shewanella sp. NIFS-20-20 TaxID=2853806 RepID=UPI001C485A92|nr:acyl-CoA dehydrogenase [Shewanella sp. NIFS-20-20]MBV7317609.1 acyl-CoA dehydrogenase [Shewanella sp. NIFS-20-20]